jgi:nanoRNase/pAp phosphatase (c-di-AMP/oligoRNAs hydrolase)
MSDKNMNDALNLINQAKTVAIVPSKVAGADSFCAAAGLYYMLLEKNKDVYFVYSGKVPEQAEEVLDSNRIASDIGQRELIVTVDYSGTPAAQAHYATNHELLEIRLGPVSKEFELNRVKAKLTGVDFDLIIVIGAQEVEDLGGTYTKMKEDFAGAKVLNVDNTRHNQNFGDVNVVNPDALTLSTLIFAKASKWNLVPNDKAAKALLTGMTYRNGNFAVDKG